MKTKSILFTVKRFYHRYKKSVFLGGLVCSLVFVFIVLKRDKIQQLVDGHTTTEIVAPQLIATEIVPDTTKRIEDIRRRTRLKEKERIEKKKTVDEVISTLKNVYTNPGDVKEVKNDTVFVPRKEQPPPTRRARTHRQRSGRSRPVRRTQAATPKAVPQAPKESPLISKRAARGGAQQSGTQSTQMYVQAITIGSHKITSGQVIQIAFQEDVLMQTGLHIPKYSIGNALVSIGRGRVSLTVRSVQLDEGSVPVSFTAYDHTYMPGLPLEDESSVDVGRELSRRGRGGLRELRNLSQNIPYGDEVLNEISRLGRELLRNKNPKIMLPDNYMFYLKIN